jgi:hypothetical protein
VVRGVGAVVIGWEGGSQWWWWWGMALSKCGGGG